MDTYTEIVEQTKELIKQELEQINCDRVAKYHGYSTKQMNRIFTAETKMSIGEYINYKKLAKAVLDLRYTKLPIIQIAQKNGYSSQESFTRALKKTFHVTPNQFRKNNSWEKDKIEKKLIEVLEETSHETARQEKIELPTPRVYFVHKAKSIWCHIARNEKGLFPHNFYVECEKNQEYEKLKKICDQNEIGGAYLTQIYKGEKFTSLTLGFENEHEFADIKYDGVLVSEAPESDYLVVNVPPYQHYELGAHVLAAWNVFSNFDYDKYQLKRDLDHAPIYEWDSKIKGYTLYFPICKHSWRKE